MVVRLFYSYSHSPGAVRVCYHYDFTAFVLIFNRLKPRCNEFGNPCPGAGKCICNGEQPAICDIDKFTLFSKYFLRKTAVKLCHVLAFALLAVYCNDNCFIMFNGFAGLIRLNGPTGSYQRIQSYFPEIVWQVR